MGVARHNEYGIVEEGHEADVADIFAWLGASSGHVHDDGGRRPKLGPSQVAEDVGWRAEEGPTGQQTALTSSMSLKPPCKPANEKF